MCLDRTNLPIAPKSNLVYACIPSHERYPMPSPFYVIGYEQSSAHTMPIRTPRVGGQHLEFTHCALDLREVGVDGTGCLLGLAGLKAAGVSEVDGGDGHEDADERERHLEAVRGGGLADLRDGGQGRGDVINADGARMVVAAESSRFGEVGLVELGEIEASRDGLVDSNGDLADSEERGPIDCQWWS
jgi:hypothetical protein